MKNVLVVSHADADGHVIAEQVRRNLERVPTFNVATLVDIERTKDHKTWTKLDTLHELERAELVCFVDLMFAPSSFVAEANALVDFATARSSKRFFLIDHHPLPLRLLARASNLHAVYRRDVVDCTFGNQSWMMAVAALLEKQPTRAREFTTADHKDLAEGIRRAAAPGGPLPGQKLLALLKHERWAELISLGRDDKSAHRLPRGRRPRVWKMSSPLQSLNDLASELVSGKIVRQNKRSVMSYDLEIDAKTLESKVPPQRQDHASPSHPRSSSDLEVIVTLLELAAISLTSQPDVVFTKEELMDEAKSISDVELTEFDVDLVLDKATFLAREKQRKFRLK